jgi:hypothetical protein
MALGRVIAYPIFPVKHEQKFSCNGQKVTLLVFLHVISGLVVIIGMTAAGQSRHEAAKLKTWIAVMTSVAVGLMSLIVLLVLGCKTKLTTSGNTKSESSDPSLNLRMIFLWVFGLTVIGHVALNFAIYIECIDSYSLDSIESIFSVISNINLVMFIIIQLGFITYYKNTMIVQSATVNFTTTFILVANFVMWLNTMVSNIHVFELMRNTTVPRYSNESYCFRTSNIQLKLVRKLLPFLLPPRMEFCILSSSFIVYHWRCPVNDSRNKDNNHGYEDLSQSGVCQESSSRRHIDGRHICALFFGIFINLPSVLSNLLLSFSYNWKSDSTFFALHLGKGLSALGTIVIVYFCSYHLKKHFSNSLRQARLTVDEYILILTSSGKVAYYMLGVLAAIQYPTPMTIFVCSRLFCIVEIFLQTLFLIKVRRFRSNDRYSILISSGGIILTVTNLISWFMNSYMQHTFMNTLETFVVGQESWLYLNNALFPLLTFYRFFSGMGAYSFYHKFKPNLNDISS